MTSVEFLVYLMVAGVGFTIFLAGFVVGWVGMGTYLIRTLEKEANGMADQIRKTMTDLDKGEDWKKESPKDSDDENWLRKNLGG